MPTDQAEPAAGRPGRFAGPRERRLSVLAAVTVATTFATLVLASSVSHRLVCELRRRLPDLQLDCTMRRRQPDGNAEARAGVHRR